jgi:hypothetical protein
MVLRGLGLKKNRKKVINVVLIIILIISIGYIFCGSTCFTRYLTPSPNEKELTNQALDIWFPIFVDKKDSIVKKYWASDTIPIIDLHTGISKKVYKGKVLLPIKVTSFDQVIQLKGSFVYTKIAPSTTGYTLEVVKVYKEDNGEVQKIRSAEINFTYMLFHWRFKRVQL